MLPIHKVEVCVCVCGMGVRDQQRKSFHPAAPRRCIHITQAELNSYMLSDSSPIGNTFHILTCLIHMQLFIRAFVPTFSLWRPLILRGMVNNNGAFSIKQILSYTLTSEAYLRSSEYEDHTDKLSNAHDGTQRKTSLQVKLNEFIFFFLPVNDNGNTNGGRLPTFGTSRVERH